MALIVSAASGNFNAGATWVGGVVPTVGDEARASTGHTITITANATCDEVSNAGTGIFTLNDGVTLTANVTSKSTTTSRNCLQFTAASPASASIVGNVTGGTVSGAVGVAHTSTGTLTITGNILAGSASNAHAVSLSSSGAINVTGNVTGGSATAYGINKSANSSASITGNVSGGSGNQGIGILCSHTTASFTVTGNVNGGTAANANGIYFSGTGTITVSGIATGGTLGPVSGSNTGAGIHQIGSGTVIVKRAVGNAYGPGNVSGLAPTPGISNNAAGIFQVEELEFGQYGMSPTTGAGIRLKKVTGNYVTFPYVDAGAAKTLVDATQGQMPAASDVRFGTVYASGTLTGSCYVPAAASVAFGVPVDNTTGTAALTPASIWDYALSAITTSSTIGKLLKDNVDATISSRSTATTAGIADAVWDELLDDHTTNGSFGARIVRSLNSNNTLQLTGSHHAAADVHEFQNEVIADYAFAPSAVTLFTDAVRTELATELTAITELHLIHGLKNGSTLTVTPTSRSAGAVSQTIGGDGTTSTTVSRD